MTTRTRPLIRRLIAVAKRTADALAYRRDWLGAAEALNQALRWEIALQGEQRRWATN